MKNWQKNRNYRKHEDTDGSFTYVITVDGVDVEVCAEVYRAYASAERKMEYMERDLKRDRFLQDANGKAIKNENGQLVTLPEREVSLDKLLAEDWDYPSAEPSPENQVVGQIEIEMLYHSLDSLDADERALINALFFNGMTEREYAKEIGVTQKAVNKRKHKVLEKLKNLFSEK